MYVRAFVAATQVHKTVRASCLSMLAMRVTTFTDYAFRVLMYLALQDERRATVDEIAHAYGISANHLTKVVHQLGRSGWVHTARGKGGGLALGRPAEQIRLGDVARLCEGDIDPAGCLVNDPKPCRIAGTCHLTGILSRAFRTFYDELNQYTLADLVRQPEALHERLMAE